MFATVATTDTAKNNRTFAPKSPTYTSSSEIIRSEMRTRYRTRAQARREEERLKLELCILESAREKVLPHDRLNKQTKGGEVTGGKVRGVLTCS